MSNFNLRALLEDSEFCSTLSNSPAPTASNNNSHSIIYKKGDYESDMVVHVQTASLLQNNIWGNLSDNYLECMDIDEFLSETGLIDTNFTGLVDDASSPQQITYKSSPPTAFSQSPPISYTRLPQPTFPRSPQTAFGLSPLRTFPPSPKTHEHSSPPPPPQTSCLEKLLLTTGTSPSPVRSNSPSSLATMETSSISYSYHNPRPVQQVSPVHHSIVTHTTSGSCSEKLSQNTDTGAKPVVTKSVTLTASQIVKKRRYSEDGEGLTDTSVVVVPGQNGFDPTVTKFSAEELQPQPLIKKSKKQFVPEENKDDKYWKRRNKNNVAAKRSREARRAKENQIIMRAEFLEREIDRLSGENGELQQKNGKLHDIIKQLQGGRS